MVVYRVDQPSSLAQQQVNKGNLALMQQQKEEGGSRAILQDFGPEKNLMRESEVSGSEAAMQKQLSQALEEVQNNRVILQNFHEKN